MMNSALAPSQISPPNSMIAFSVGEHVPDDVQTFDVSTPINML